jgi:very-short-patch-repair endonuclease
MEYEENVLKFLDWCSTEVGKYEADLFNADTWCEYGDLEIKSPIEQILYAAMKAVCALNSIEPADPEEFKGEMIIIGISIDPQFKIGKYRVDFQVSYGTYSTRWDLIKAPKQRQGMHGVSSSVIVECDSQQFHERTERERRYEKERDRFLQSSGNVVFRYTGSEIVKRPMEIAAEIISFVTGVPQDMLQIDSNIEDGGK